jgi:hypothetical protein
MGYLSSALDFGMASVDRRPNNRDHGYDAHRSRNNACASVISSLMERAELWHMVGSLSVKHFTQQRLHFCGRFTLRGSLSLRLLPRPSRHTPLARLDRLRRRTIQVRPKDRLPLSIGSDEVIE